MKLKNEGKKYYVDLQMDGTIFWQEHIKRALTKRTRMSALRKIELKFGKSIDVSFTNASRVGNKLARIHVSSMHKNFVQQAVMILQQAKSAIEKLRRFVKCEKKFRGTVVGKGREGVRDIAKTAGSGTGQSLKERSVARS